MSLKYQKQEFVKACLTEHAAQNGEGLTGSEVGKWIIENRFEACEKKANDSTFINKKKFFEDDGITLDKESYKWTLAAEITSSYAPKYYKRKNPPQWFKDGIRFHDTTPRKYYLAKDIENYEKEWSHLTTSSDTSTDIKDSKDQANDLYDGHEEDLYPKLGIFLDAEYDILSRRIDHLKTKKGKLGDNSWLFPDVVGLEKLGEEFNDGIKKLSDKKFKLWSFEVKKDLTRGQVRRAYFQAVSNSSWANFGYLVTTELTPDAKEELKILANLYGIGVIQLNHENPAESRAIIPARENENIDWDIADRIADISEDFEKYIKSIVFYKNNYNEGDKAINKKDWGLTPKDEDKE